MTWRKPTSLKTDSWGLSKPSEGEIAKQFDHPRIVKTLDYGLTTNNEHYVLMEYLAGPGMNAFIQQQSAVLQGKRLQLIRNMVEALKVVHDAGYIHRDVCPRNFICERDGSSLKLIDFGLTVPATKQFMQPGNRTGTPNYMAPEIVRRRTTDQRLDIFAFGVTAFQLCTYQLPWQSQEVSGKAALSHDTKPPVDIFEAYPNIDRKLGETIMRCISVQPDDRPDSFEAVRRMLEPVGQDEA